MILKIRGNCKLDLMTLVQMKLLGQNNHPRWIILPFVCEPALQLPMTAGIIQFNVQPYILNPISFRLGNVFEELSKRFNFSLQDRKSTKGRLQQPLDPTAVKLVAINISHYMPKGEIFHQCAAGGI